MTTDASEQVETKPWLGLLGGAVAVAIWAGWISATRFAVSGSGGTPTDPLVLAICRAGLPAVVLAPVIWRRGLVPAGARLGPILLMALGWGAPFTFFVGEGLKTVPASLFGPLVPGMAPIIVTVLAWLVFREHPSRQFIWGLALIGSAMAAVLGQWLWHGEFAALAGAPFLLMASLGISVYTLMFRASGLSAVEATAYISLYSLPVLAIWALLVPEALFVPGPSEWAFHALTQGLLTGVGAVLAYGLAVRHLGAVRGSTANALVPVCAALVGVSVLGEALTMLEWGAVVAASLGVAVVNDVFSRRRAAGQRST
ncbi:MAG: DMT family transporter [Pseudomonadota bacterium]